MSDPIVLSRDLSARAAGLALRIAAVLEERVGPDGGTAVAFLRSWAAEAGEPSGEPGPFDVLSERFRLGLLDQDLILLAGLPEEHEGLASTLRTLNVHGEPRVTAGLAALLIGDRVALRWALTEGAAVRHRLLRIADPAVPLYERSLTLADRLWEALHGNESWPSTMERRGVPEAPAGLRNWLKTPAVQRAVSAIANGGDRTLLLTSADEAVGLGRCAAVAAEAGVPLVAAAPAPHDHGAIALLVAHATVRGAVPVIVVPPPAEGSIVVPVLATRDLPGPILVCAAPGSVRAPGGRPVQQVPAGPADVDDCREAWRSAVPHLAEHAGRLAARYPLDPALIAELAVDASDQAGLPAPEIGLPDIPALIRARAGLTLPAGMTLTTPDVPWERLVVTEDIAGQLRDSVARLALQSVVLDDWGLRERARASRGTRLLFSGPPGTGKSLAAEAVATAAGTDLLVVDVSRVVSKWIGETEKNLATAFDAAERTQAVLFLDEADALFGMRTEISDAHDRYANLETAYLLQRLDRFDGLAVLATNLSHNIDPAFLRRMDTVVEFGLPDLDGRRALWPLHLPPGILAPSVDLTMLARLYPVPGGWIRNAAIAAAFLAAAEDRPICQRHLVTAIRREYAKAALPFPGEPPRRPDDGA
ncbi:ATP-binding protein [Longispora albida]|uniref:ATP-binding protein n=1 Tax=Longispora albida TaxID=203523 RepID=UPI0003624462|nr:AAA family ATPase [Longispora albida]